MLSLNLPSHLEYQMHEVVLMLATSNFIVTMEHTLPLNRLLGQEPRLYINRLFSQEVSPAGDDGTIDMLNWARASRATAVTSAMALSTVAGEELDLELRL
jgi:hypothetical protein